MITIIINFITHLLESFSLCLFSHLYIISFINSIFAGYQKTTKRTKPEHNGYVSYLKL